MLEMAHMIKLKILAIIMVMAFALPVLNVGAADDTPWSIPVCPYLALPTGIASDESVHDAVAYKLAAFARAGCQCEDALNFVVYSIEDTLRRGSSLDMPANGVLYADLLHVSADMAQESKRDALSAMAGEGFTQVRPLNAIINFVAGGIGELDITFPDDVSGVDFGYISVEAGFAAITFCRDVVSGNTFRLAQGTLTTTGGYAYVPVPTIVAGLAAVHGWLGFIVDYWAVVVFIFVLVAWGVLASMGKRLRLWVVPVIAVILIAANIWTLGPSQERPDGVDTANAPARVYFYSVLVDMEVDVSAVLSIPLGGADPEGLVLVDGSGEPLVSRYNPFTDAIDARIYRGGTYFLRIIE